jgi:hypothetical protein
MKFILDKDKVQILDKHNLKSGSINYYIAEVEHDESWDNLTIEARIVRKENGIIQEVGKSIAVINNEMYIDKELSGTYAIGFIGYTIENNVKTMQISTNLVGLYFNMGAGEIEVDNSQDLPTPTEWEVYISQIQEMIDGIEPVPKGGTTGQALVKKSDTDGDVEWKTIESGGSIATVVDNTLEIISQSVRVVEEELIF